MDKEFLLLIGFIVLGVGIIGAAIVYWPAVSPYAEIFLTSALTIWFSYELVKALILGKVDLNFIEPLINWDTTATKNTQPIEYWIGIILYIGMIFFLTYLTILPLFGILTYLGIGIVLLAFFILIKSQTNAGGGIKIEQTIPAEKIIQALEKAKKEKSNFITFIFPKSDEFVQYSIEQGGFLLDVPPSEVVYNKNRFPEVIRLLENEGFKKVVKKAKNMQKFEYTNIDGTIYAMFGNDTKLIEHFTVEVFERIFGIEQPMKFKIEVDS